jgi:hypothetical protein
LADSHARNASASATISSSSSALDMTVRLTAAPRPRLEARADGTSRPGGLGPRMTVPRLTCSVRRALARRTDCL